MRVELKHWAALLALVAMFGSAFLLTKIAVTHWDPVIVVTGRIVVAAILLSVWAYLIGERVHSVKKHLWLFLLLGITGNCLPFFVISWGQQYVDSGLAGILMAFMPLIAIVLAHYWLPNEPLTVRRIIGFGLGFLGVVVLMEPQHLFSSSREAWPWLAMLAILLGASSYAVNSVLAKFSPDANLILISAIVLCFSSFIMLPIAVVQTPISSLTFNWPAIVSVLVLGIFSTGLATILYFYVIRHAGPAFLSQINYLIPIWAVLLGISFGGEQLSVFAVLALLLILSGIAIAKTGTVQRDHE